MHPCQYVAVLNGQFLMPTTDVLQSICYKIAPQVNRKSQHSSLLISDWLRDYLQENEVPLYFMVKYARN